MSNIHQGMSNYQVERQESGVRDQLKDKKKDRIAD